MTDPILINFGGFVPLSTVDWRGRSVCVIFFRGCPVRCWYCHNVHLQNGTEMMTTDDVLGMVKSADLLISGVVFSGGEATMQPEALLALAEGVKQMGLCVGLHTNGVYPEVIRSLIDKRLLDFVALDMKPEWNLNTVRGKERALGTEVGQTLQICTTAFYEQNLPQFEVVLTLFPGSGDQISMIAPNISDGVDLVLQQGEYTGIRALQMKDLTIIADGICRPVRIRTREEGEIKYEGTRDCGNAGIRQG
ncbi:MAG: anaerobic ribonucleoside-triphosphate reductase activating protein [Methanomicrobiales archaeon HGW-Methanomicrobiales-4]|nr:MAG: anaerobic ribonucleoside-triphosphate reductase activating protein [Methanomicrobiales archaeon HGW-Methanomicrobiales-4]